MRTSTAIAIAIGIGAILGGIVIGVPAVRKNVIPAPAAAPATAETTAPATLAETAAPVAEQKPTGPVIDVQTALKERVLGDANAPLTFYDYSSLSCPHCADFHTRVFPRLKRDYIDTGKVKMVFRPFPLNEPALLAEKLARCAPEEDYFKLLDIFFSKQQDWLFNGNPRDNLRQMVKVAGINDELFDACIANKPLEDGIMKIAQDGVERFKLKGTPTFILGEDSSAGQVLTGETEYDTFTERFDALLSQKMVTPPSHP